MYNKYNLLIIVATLLWLLPACRHGDEVVYMGDYASLPFEPRPQTAFADNEPIGLYLLNEGNMGLNKASIDYVDFCNAQFVKSIYTDRNPMIVKQLGDVGNDIQVYGNRLYAVINCSHKVEVMDVRTCHRIGQVDIPNCRYIRFKGDKAYVSSYVGPVGIDPNAQLGAVFEIDTATLQITRKVSVGYQPEEMEIIENQLFCVNSGGYMEPHYDSTISVVDLNTFKQVRKFPVAINLHRIRKDHYGKLWVTSRGNYEDISSCLCVLEVDSKGEMAVTDALPIPCSEMVIVGDSLYFYAVHWSETEMANTISYGIIDVRTKTLLTSHFITDGSETDIELPYGLAVNPYNGDIYVTDAKNYVTSGTLHCYDRLGRRKWSVRTGDIPAHLTFVYKTNPHDRPDDKIGKRRGCEG